ncbi:hypothetical protein P5800_24005, partial [Bacillus paranthracis]|nr:hypothetical protein [Bacillus paranthracis]
LFMPINFHDANNKYTYAQRNAHISWREMIKEGYKQYELHATVPVQGASESQLKSLETYYENYDLKILNSKQEKIGVFQNIIQIVKEYGEKMNLQR